MRTIQYCEVALKQYVITKKKENEQRLGLNLSLSNYKQ